MFPAALYARVQLVMRKSHARSRVQQAPGLPCASNFEEGQTKMQTSGDQRREKAKSYPRRCERSEAIHCHPMHGKMDCFASLAMTETDARRETGWAKRSVPTIHGDCCDRWWARRKRAFAQPTALSQADGEDDRLNATPTSTPHTPSPPLHRSARDRPARCRCSARRCGSVFLRRWLMPVIQELTSLESRPTPSALT